MGEISVALATCDAMVALLTSDFAGSAYCDQELGFAQASDDPAQERSGLCRQWGPRQRLRACSMPTSTPSAGGPRKPPVRLARGWLGHR